MKQLVIYDTSNYVDFPIGGQLTSVHNFLSYISNFQRNYCEKILLIGVTTDKTQLGKISFIENNGIKIDFIPVVYRNSELYSVKKSLRLEFTKGLFKYYRIIPHGKNVLHYIHTPEAFLQIKIMHPFDKVVVFSHGSFFNMVKGFRFYKDNKFVCYLFNSFIKWMIKHANLIFVLDQDSLNQYLEYNQNVIKVDNSIVLPNFTIQNKQKHSPLRLLFVGRLSKVKRIDEIIRAVDICNEDIIFNIVGDGEEREYLQSIKCSKRIKFSGALKPEDVKEEMNNSDILIMNSILEGKPMTIIEAMSFGLPIITTDVGGISELVDFGINAIKTNGCKDEIVKAINIILSSYDSFSNSSLEKSKKFDYKTVNSQIFACIKELYY